MTVMKFGGAVLHSTEGFHRMVQILQDTDRALVVVSAVASTTRDLETCARTALKGASEDAKKLLASLLQTHVDLATATVTTPTHASAVVDHLNISFRELEKLLDGVAITRQLTPKTLDRILSYGERFALDIATQALAAKGLDAVSVDAQRVLITSDRYGSAVPIASKSRVLADHTLRPLLDAHRFVVIQGFVGATEEGAATTMGKESSNLSATFLASLIGASQVVIWTDVEGVRSGDPKLMGTTSLRPALSFKQARDAAHHGLKLLYRTMIEPAESAGIPITIASSEAPYGERTVISGDESAVDPIVTLYPSANLMEHQISIVFASPPVWIEALAASIGSVADSSELSVSSNPAEHVVTIRLPVELAPLLARQLHDTLNNIPQRSS